MAIAQSTEIDRINLSAFDFVDFGWSCGNSVKFAKDRLKGRRGLGLDISASKVQ